jgi:DNA repair protein RadC
MQTDTIRLRELRVRYAVKKDDEGRPIMIGRALTNPSESASLLMTLLQDEPAEVFAILCLTTKHRVIAYHEVSRGTLDAALVTPRLCWAEHKAEIMWRRSLCGYGHWRAADHGDRDVDRSHITV